MRARARVRVRVRARARVRVRARARVRLGLGDKVTLLIALDAYAHRGAILHVRLGEG